jgi:hypothetical protein
VSQQLLSLVVTALDNAGIDYMVTGSVASSLHGEPWSTHDMDLVVSIDAASAKKLAEAFRPPKYYLNADAIAAGGMFNLIAPETGDKVDFWVLTATPFDRSCFARKYQEEFAGAMLKVQTPEDTILSKLWWASQLKRIHTIPSWSLRVDYA